MEHGHRRGRREGGSSSAHSGTPTGGDREGAEAGVYFASRLSDGEGSAWPRVASLSSLVAFLVLVGLMAAFLFIGTRFSPATYQGILLVSISGSVVASTIMYVLLSWFVEPARQEAQAQQTTRYAIAVAHEQFQARFEVSLPTATYEASDIPKGEFSNAFVRLLLASRRYDHKGTAGRFTTFRLTRLHDHDEVRKLREIRLCLLDPRAEDPIRAHAIHRIRERRQNADDDSIAEEMQQIREDVFVSLVALFGIRNSLPTTVFLHTDLPFFRCEMFDTGMFLTYYLGGARYPATLQFSSDTQPYEAYRYSLDLTHNYAPVVLEFKSSGPPGTLNTVDKLMAQLAELGCDLDLTGLQNKWNYRSDRLQAELQKAGIAPLGLF